MPKSSEFNGLTSNSSPANDPPTSGEPPANDRQSLCANCGSPAKPEKHLKAYDLTNTSFCSLDCFKEYYRKQSYNVATSHERLTQAHILKAHEEDISFHQPLEDKGLEEQLAIISRRIEDLRAIQDYYKYLETLAHKRTMNIRAVQEAKKVEYLRAHGANSIVENTMQLRSKLHRMIVSYRKMNQSDKWVLETLLTITKYSKDQILKEMEIVNGGKTNE